MSSSPDTLQTPTDPDLEGGAAETEILAQPNNGLAVITATAAQLLQSLDAAVAAVPPATVPGLSEVADPGLDAAVPADRPAADDTAATAAEPAAVGPIEGTGGNDVLVGTRQADIILGGGGDDFIDAGAGDDRIDGGAGNDIIVTGGGRDVVVLGRGTGTDIITDFKPRQDKLDLSAFFFDAAMAKAAARQVGDDVVIDLSGDGADTVRLLGVKASRLNADSFIVAEKPTIGIFDIQGEGHTSSYAGQRVTTSGVVTAVVNNGFYLQDFAGDGKDSTSDALFVFTSSRPTVAVGSSLFVTGNVSEFIPGGASTNNLSITQMTSPSITTFRVNGELPEATVLGKGGRLPPTAVIEDDNFTSFDPAQDGIDFYESLEGMRVTVKDAVAASPTNRFNEIFALADNGKGATGVNERGGITIGPDDFNPERIQIQINSTLTPGFSAKVDTGDKLGDVTGVVSYAFGNFEVLATEPFTPVSGGLAREVTKLAGTARQLTVASYNVENLDPNDSDGDRDIADGKFATIAQQIVTNLKAPDIIALQEIQDNSGSTNNGVVDASLTYQTLIDAIVAAGGPTYSFIDLPPVNNQDGGQPGGNIRNGYLYNGDRVDYVTGSAERIVDTDLSNGDAFLDSRKSVAARFEFGGETVTLVNNHFASKSGSSPLFGQIQPLINGGEAQREAQATAVNAFVADKLAADADAKMIVLGDLNEFQFARTLDLLKGGADPILTNLFDLLPANEQYTYIFDGNSQALDHILVTDTLLTGALAQFDIVHMNAEFNQRGSDHDALVARFTLPGPEVLWPHDLSADTALRGTLGNDRLKGTPGDDVIFGLAGDDRLTGQAGSDYIDGGLGDDLIVGGRGVDFLIGGQGADTFQFRKGSGFDYIIDFDVAEDILDVAGFGFADAGAVRAAASRFGDDVMISLNSKGGDHVVLVGVQLADLDQATILV